MAKQSEEAKVIAAENKTEVLTAFNRIPYALINREVEGAAKDTLDELTQICKYYKVYRKGAEFITEGANGDYVPATLKYRMAASLINKEARFLFAEPPDIVVETKANTDSTTEYSKDAVSILNNLLQAIFEKNMFESILLKAAKDCFIGKRVAGLVNFNEEDGVTITFLPATQFIYDTKVGNSNVLTKFVCFIIVKESATPSEKRIFKKKYQMINGVAHLEEVIYDGAGTEIEVVTKLQPTLLDFIPAVVFVNDGLTGETTGESEIEMLNDSESWFSKLSNADIDADRKSMNPTRYTVDMDSRSTQNLSTAAGAYWDLISDQNLDNKNPMVGLLEPAMSYSATLKTTLDRIKTSAYEFVDMPNITLESLQGAITSGKSLKAIYWPLVLRSKEKMKEWGPRLRAMADIIIKGALVYPNCVKMYTNDEIFPVDYKISIAQNLPLPEDEAEEKNIDMAEVQNQVRSKKSYMIKWLQLSDTEANEMLEQIALERQILEDATYDPAADGMDEGDPTDDQLPDDDDTEIEDQLDGLEAELGL